MKTCKKKKTHSSEKRLQGYISQFMIFFVQFIYKIFVTKELFKIL